MAEQLTLDLTIKENPAIAFISAEALYNAGVTGIKRRLKAIKFGANMFELTEYDFLGRFYTRLISLSVSCPPYYDVYRHN